MALPADDRLTTSIRLSGRVRFQISVDVFQNDLQI